MTSVGFTSILPQVLNDGDEIIVKGRLKENAQKISFNFRIDDSTYPKAVALHFKTYFNDSRGVVLNAKNSDWQTEEIYENTWQDDPRSRDFYFTFVFTDDSIYIYTGDHNRVFQYCFNHRLPYRDILMFQVWDDCEKITELTYRYKN